MSSLIFILFTLLGSPLFLIFGAVALYAFFQAGIDSSAIMIEFYRLASAPTLSAIPLFTFAGYLMAESGAPKRLVNVAQNLVGWLPGGLPIVTVVVCAFFTAFTGASGVTIIALGGLLYPSLTKQNYSDKFSIGLITSSGGIGLLLPPCLPLILFGLIGHVSIDKLFLAGVFPSLLFLLSYGLYSAFISKKMNIAKIPFSFTNLKKSLREAIWEIPLPVIILYGIYGGVITPNEAGAITALYVLIVEVFVHRDINLFRDVPRIAKESMVVVGGILIILGVAMGMTNYIVDAQIPDQIFQLVQKYITSPFMFLVVLNIFLLIVGCLMDIFSAIIVVLPIIMPIGIKYGIDPVHLGMIFLTNLEVGYLTPPMGLNLFISSFRFKRPMIELYKSTLPFLLLLIFCLLMVTYIPWLSLGLIELVGIK